MSLSQNPLLVEFFDITYHRDSRFGLTWRTLLTVLNHTGFRKAEWAVARSGERTLMSYAQLAWELDGVMSREALHPDHVSRILAGSIRAVAIVFPVPSKCDPDGSAFCNKGIPFPVDVADAHCGGLLLLRLKQLVCPGVRRDTPLFADDAGAPLLGSALDRALRDALLLLSPHIAATRSWHSYRIRLASRLRAATRPDGSPQYSDATIQALLRWKTSASFNIYARYDTTVYADILRSVEHVDITSIQYANLPETSEFDRLDVLARTAEERLAESGSDPPAVGCAPPLLSTGLIAFLRPTCPLLAATGP